MKAPKLIARILSPRKNLPFENLSSWFLVPLGATSFLVAAYPGLMFAEVVPGFVSAVNKFGFTKDFWLLSGLLGVYACGAWYFGCIAARCHELLYERWFK